MEEVIAELLGNVVYETENFTVMVPEHPHIPREDGGHLMLSGKEYYESRTDFTPKLATEVMRLSMLLGEAMIAGMRARGVYIERLNYQENGNWAYPRGMKPIFHIHLYGRTKTSKTQTWGEALNFPGEFSGFYDNFDALTAEDVEEIRKRMKELENTPKYALENWNL